MKFKLLLLLFALLLAAPTSFASFPVQRTTVSETATNQVNSDEETTLFSPAALAGAKSQGVALLLWFFLGGLAAHRWYLGSPWYWNVLFIITLGGLFIWAIIDLIDIITGNYPAKGGFKSEFF
ncbi:MAG: S-adenosyl-L-homocysteine hydrolase [Flavobacteriaceae bacterium]|jgi:TM2 domain-containing membrane protein YozV|nr:S-adenosyl-L-homocysteine hydrolase [Flavobacteriaceae bacterium]HBY69764.1 TM2 domain-containing protein [Flavobacteriaceae bacterium]|tara:strand:+ start:124 stop:492 length:369 start_codon:yes stop_codon:yes gene_type:complete